MDLDEATFWAANPGLREEIIASMNDRTKRKPRPVRDSGQGLDKTAPDGHSST